MKFKKFAIVLSALVLVLGITACKDKTDGTDDAAQIEAFTKDGFAVCLASEPASIDPALNSAVDGATMLVHLNSGLYRYTQDDNNNTVLEYDLAANITKETAVVYDHEAITDTNGNITGWERVEYTNGTRYTVTLRNDITWSNGDKITSADFAYSWNRACSSTLGADYGYMFDFICDAVAHETDDTLFPTIAIEIVDNTTFTFDVMVDVAFMDQLLAFPTYQPVHRATVEKYDTNEDGTWATEAATYVSSGAYKLTKWVHDSYIVIEKRTDYWDAENITMPKITFALSDDTSAMLASYKNGDYDMIDDVPTEAIASLKTDATYSSQFHVDGQMGTYYVSFNINKNFVHAKGEQTQAAQAEIRKALGLLINRNYIVTEIGQAGQIEANAFVSQGLSDAAGGEFVDHNGTAGDGTGYYNAGTTQAAYEANVAEAITILKKYYNYNETTGKFTDFNTQNPNIIYLYNTSSGHKAIAEAIYNDLNSVGITIQLQNEEWNSFLDNRKKGNYTIARNGWIADYDDPSSYLSMWTTASGNNDCQFGKGDHATVTGYSISYENADGQTVTYTGTWAQTYDKVMAESNKETNATVRFNQLHALETLLMETGAICPIYYYTDLYLLSNNYEGFFSIPLGYKFFMYMSAKTA